MCKCKVERLVVTSLNTDQVVCAHNRKYLTTFFNHSEISYNSFGFSLFSREDEA